MRRMGTHPRAGLEDDPLTVFSSLRTFCDSKGYVFWEDSISLRDTRLFDPSVILSHKQLPDVYLLALATRKRGRLATFDARIPLKAVRGATRDNIAVIAPA